MLKFRCAPYPFSGAFVVRFVSACALLAFSWPVCADNDFIFWLGETPLASGVPSRQWFFAGENWEGGLYPGNTEFPPEDTDVAVYQFHADVTPVDNTWIVQLGSAGVFLPARHSAAQVHPGNWHFRFEAPGLVPTPGGEYTFRGFQSA